MANHATTSWLSPDQRCTHCLQPYSYISIRHCHLCDGPACPHCVTVAAETEEVVCVRCEQTPEEEP